MPSRVLDFNKPDAIYFLLVFYEYFIIALLQSRIVMNRQLTTGLANGRENRTLFVLSGDSTRIGRLGDLWLLIFFPCVFGEGKTSFAFPSIGFSVCLAGVQEMAEGGNRDPKFDPNCCEVI